jgi:cytidine deaminase
VDADGHTHTGSNVENAVYPLTMCAERVAIFEAVSSGARRILAVAVVTQDGGSPCGSCRQVMREFADDDMPVFIADLEGNCRAQLLGALLPDSFTVDNLKEGNAC